MPWTGSGSFNRTNGTFTGPAVWAEDKAAGTLITTDNHDTHDEDLADGINACLAKNGENAPSGNLPMGGFAHTGVGNATARTQYPSVASLQDGTHRYKADSGAADAYVITPVPAISAYAEGQRFVVKIANVNTGASTLNVSALGVKAILKDGVTALAAGDLPAGAIVAFTYDGTDFQLDRSVNTDFGSGGISTDVIAESTSAAGVTVDGLLIKDSTIDFGATGLSADVIAESTSTAGVTVDGVLLKDGGVTLTTNISIGGQAYVPPLTLTPAATVTWDTDDGSFAIVTLDQASTLAKPTNIVAGGTYTLYVFQDATGSRTLDYASGIAWPNSVKPVLTTAANALDIITFSTWNGTALFGVVQYNFGVP